MTDDHDDDDNDGDNDEIMDGTSHRESSHSGATVQKKNFFEDTDDEDEMDGTQLTSSKKNIFESGSEDELDPTAKEKVAVANDDDTAMTLNDNVDEMDGLKNLHVFLSHLCVTSEALTAIIAALRHIHDASLHTSFASVELASTILRMIAADPPTLGPWPILEGWPTNFSTIQDVLNQYFALAPQNVQTVCLERFAMQIRCKLIAHSEYN